MTGEEEVTIDMPLGYLLSSVSNWEEFCDEVGLEPYLLNEGRASENDTWPVSVAVLEKYGVLNK